jgi:hypothetical protein
LKKSDSFPCNEGCSILLTVFGTDAPTAWKIAQGSFASYVADDYGLYGAGMYFYIEWQLMIGRLVLSGHS